MATRHPKSIECRKRLQGLAAVADQSFYEPKLWDFQYPNGVASWPKKGEGKENAFLYSGGESSRYALLDLGNDQNHWAQ